MQSKGRERKGVKAWGEEGDCTQGMGWMGRGWGSNIVRICQCLFPPPGVKDG